MKKIVIVILLALFSLVAQAKHYSFIGGYPANAVTAERVKTLEKGGVSLKVRQDAIKTIEGVVTKVSDGDTIWVTTTNNVRHKIRFDRIDTPESNQAWGKESTKYLKELIFNKTVKVEYKKLDQYGRVLGIVYLNGEDINLKMVATGNAWLYKYYKPNKEYSKALEKARKDKLGLWSDPTAIDPHEFRKRKRKM